MGSYMEPYRVLPGTKKGSPMGTAEEPLWNPFSKSVWQVFTASHPKCCKSALWTLPWDGASKPHMCLKYSRNSVSEPQLIEFTSHFVADQVNPFIHAIPQTRGKHCKATTLHEKNLTTIRCHLSFSSAAPHCTMLRNASYFSPTRRGNGEFMFFSQYTLASLKTILRPNVCIMHNLALEQAEVAISFLHLSHSLSIHLSLWFTLPLLFIPSILCNESNVESWDWHCSSQCSLAVFHSFFI
jgi:hypothetical protein